MKVDRKSSGFLVFYFLSIWIPTTNCQTCLKADGLTAKRLLRKSLISPNNAFSRRGRCRARSAEG
jgi:hypothetical protein